jgi:hypothetical protein
MIKDIKDNYLLHIVMVLFCIGVTLIIDGIIMDPLFGNQYIKTTIKITYYNSSNINSHYSFTFDDNFSCKTESTDGKTKLILGKTCVINNNICSYYSPCPNIIVGNNYTYFCDCTTFTCGFKEFYYYKSNAFIVLICGVTIVLTILCLTFIRCISNIKYKKNKTKVNLGYEFDTINIDINSDI